MVVLIAIIVVPGILLTLLKTNATIAFLSLCAGYVLLRFSGEEVVLVASAVNKTYVATQSAQIAVMVLPAVLSALVMRGTVSGPKLVANMIPALALGLLAALLVVPMLPGGIQYNMTHTEAWEILDKAKSLVAGGGILLSLMTLWLGHRRHEKHGKKKHH